MYVVCIALFLSLLLVKKISDSFFQKEQELFFWNRKLQQILAKEPWYIVQMKDIWLIEEFSFEICLGKVGESKCP